MSKKDKKKKNKVEGVKIKNENKEAVRHESSKKTSKELAAEYLDGWKRCMADYDNLKKEMDEKSKQWIDVGIMRVIEQLIPVYNNFKSAVEHIPPDQQELPWVTGVMYIKQNIEEMFKELDLEIIPTVGEIFDDSLHEAVSEDEGDGKSGEIIREVSVGFKKNGKVILPAKVVVIK